MSPDFPIGKVGRNWIYEFDWCGETRVWVNTEGKSLTARLICLTDENVALRIGWAIARKAAIANKLQILSPPRLRVELDTIDPTYLPRGRLPIKECVWFYRVTFMDDQAAWMSNRGAFTVTMSGAVATLQSGNGE